MTPMMLRTCSDGAAPGGIRPSPVERILGPGTSPDSMRSRSRRVFSHMDDRSNTLVNPYCGSMSRTWRLSWGDRVETFRQAAPPPPIPDRPISHYQSLQDRQFRVAKTSRHLPPPNRLPP